MPPTQRSHSRLTWSAPAPSRPGRISFQMLFSVSVSRRIARDTRTIMPRRQRIRKISSISSTPAISTATPRAFSSGIPW